MDWPQRHGDSEKLPLRVSVPLWPIRESFGGVGQQEAPLVGSEAPSAAGRCKSSRLRPLRGLSYGGQARLRSLQGLSYGGQARLRNGSDADSQVAATVC